MQTIAWWIVPLLALAAGFVGAQFGWWLARRR
jgi:uncharacterized membrane protein YfcA